MDAKKYPDIGKIPEWQFTTINAGDCLYLPSQMWHQVKSYGESNKAIAFLFSQFNKHKNINTSECPEKVVSIPLSEVDVDLQYPGYGIMPMGNSEISAIKQDLPQLINETTGYVTKRSTFQVVYQGHESGAKNKELMVQKAKNMYAYLLEIAGGTKEKMTTDFLRNLTRAQIRPLYPWLFPIEPAGSYNHEYSVLLPEDLTDTIENMKSNNKGVLQKKDFLKVYQDIGGTLKFAENFWQKLAGDKNEISDTSKTIADALAPYEYHRREDPDREVEDDDAVIVTPQGHKSQPKKMKGGYAQTKEEEEEEPEETYEEYEEIEDGDVPDDDDEEMEIDDEKDLPNMKIEL